MIKKLKLKFILLSMTSLFLLLTTLVAGMNIINYTTVLYDADEILSLLSQNKGAFPGFDEGNFFDPDRQPEMEEPDIGVLPEEPTPGAGNRLPSHMSPELPYESRYFSVLLAPSGDVIYTDISRITSIDEATAIEYATYVAQQRRDSGFVGDFRYARSFEGSTVRITFLDCGRKLESFLTFLYTSIFIALAGFAVVLFVICFFAGRIIRPIAESYEKQKRFITDAGHEIKTPLTIINANVDILEMELGEHESLSDIRQQAKRLTALTGDLVYLSRMEEQVDTMPMIEFPVSEMVQEAAEAFRAPMQAEDKTLLCRIQPMLTLRGNGKAIGQLVSILMDNALKYSPKGATITLELSGQNRNVVLSVHNPTDFAVESENLDCVFDRFYRTDTSRNSQTGGHGIGLSVAKAITQAHGGKITAHTKDGRSFLVTVTLPM